MKLNINEIEELNDKFADGVGYDFNIKKPIPHGCSLENLRHYQDANFLHIEWDHNYIEGTGENGSYDIHVYCIQKNFNTLFLSYMVEEEYYDNNYSIFGNDLATMLSQLNFDSSLRDIIQQLQFVYL